MTPRYALRCTMGNERAIHRRTAYYMVLHANESWKKSCGPCGKQLFKEGGKNWEESPITLLQGFSHFCQFQVTTNTNQPNYLLYCRRKRWSSFLLLPVQRTTGLILNYSSLKKVSLFFQIYHF